MQQQLLTHLHKPSRPGQEPEPPYWGPSSPGRCWSSGGQRGARMEAGRGRCVPACLQCCPRIRAQLCGRWDCHTTLPGSKILRGPCQAGNAERQEDGLWAEHCRGRQGLTVQSAEMSLPLGSPFFTSAKLGSSVHSAFLTKLLFNVLSI